MRRASALALLALGAVLFIFLTNAAFFTRDEKGSPLPLPEPTNWEARGGVLVSLADPQLTFSGLSGRIETLTLKGTVEGDVRPAVYYAKAGEAFSEERKLLPAYREENGAVILDIGVEAESLRVDLTESAGMKVSLTGASRYPAVFDLDAVGLLSTLFALTLALAPLILPRGALPALWGHARRSRKFEFLLQNLVRRDIITKYRRSVLGILWSVLNPLLMMMVITAVFYRLFHFQVENFPMYYLTGTLIFGFVSEATTASMSSIVASGSLLRKVYIPKYIFPLAKCIFALVNALFSFAAVLVMLLILGMKFHWTLLLFFVPLSYAFLFACGLGMMLAAANVFFRDMTHLYGVWTVAWMYLTPIIYPMSILPEAVKTVVYLNPLYYYVDYMRQLVIYGAVPGLRENAVCAMFSAAFLILGTWVFFKTQDRFVLHI